MSDKKSMMSNGADSSSDSIAGDGDSRTEDRDEILEILKLSQKETFRILLWRVVVTGVLAATAFAVTFTTYRVLVQEQHESFEQGFVKFSTTVGDAAVRQQETMRDSFRAVANAITSDSLRINATWPYYTTPYYQLYAGNALAQSNAEIAAYFPLVQQKDREKWGNYSAKHLTEWAHPGHMIKYGNLNRLNETNFIADMRKKDPELGFIPDDEWYEYWPMWLYSPPPAQYGAVNWNLINVPDYEAIITAMKALPGESLINKVRQSVSTGTAFTEEEHNAMHSRVKTGSRADYPHSFMWTPIYDNLNISQSNFVSVVGTGFAWDFSLRNLLPASVEGVMAVLSNNCDQTYTFEISGIDAYFIGEGDLHEPTYDSYRVVRELSVLNNPVGAKAVQGHCEYTMNLYPSSTFENSYNTNTPEVFAVIVALTFGMVAVVFLVYDILVQKRNNKLVARAARLNAVVSSLFPNIMRDRILAQGTKSQMKSFLKDGIVGLEDSNNKPIADLFLSTTIMFADIVGFTAWSSVREPFQVFTLLEAVYSCFDSIAKSRNVFKVETVGDCYVAASGIPEPRKDHPLVMARFASDCIKSMRRVVKGLEVLLGPDTGDLTIRVGLHSGPVTAGVLRGERARFQLFGDTMNTTSRIESASEGGRILVSQETADLIADSGKQHWLQARNDLVEAKGKGPMQTFWVNVRESRTSGIVAGSSHHSSDHDGDEIYLDGAESAKQQRLVDWNVELLSRLLKQVIARRKGQSEKVQEGNGATKLIVNVSPCPLDDVREIITLPEYDTSLAHGQDPILVELNEKVLKLLRDYVSAISQLYRNNPFHNFEHASHVAMSVQKLLSRIVAPDKFHDDHDVGTDDVAASMHDHTYGITSDPLTQFACAFSAMIHDVDHTGVPNTQLIKENVAMAATYQERSVAEQNSLDLAWNLLMDDHYKDLRALIYTTESELRRFRDLLVNCVMATDICDKQLKELRNSRWEKAFATEKNSNPTSLVENRLAVRDCVNRKATIVIEHLIQASDVSHTMQHWHVYRKWNERLFLEMYDAFKSGRASSNPADSWYKGELGFFDFYIIPLAKKLKECGVFGVSSDEFLNYALNNRREWEVRGEEVIAEMMQNVDVVNETTEKTVAEDLKSIYSI